MLDSLSLIKSWKTQLPLFNLSPQLLKHKDEDLYYKTDHHWSFKGAYYAYTSLLTQWRMSPFSYDYFLPFEVKDFTGTYYNKSRFESINSESLVLTDPKIISYETNEKTYSSLINQTTLNGSNQYAAFLYGNHGFAHITVKDSTSPKKLLVIKDSYASSLIPFLTSAFDEIDVIDLRQFNGSLNAIMSSQDYDQVFLLHYFNQFCDEVNEAKLRY